jgi:hypothetical protein
MSLINHKGNIINLITDPDYPNVIFINYGNELTLVKINNNRYELKRGNLILGVVHFHDGHDKWGWQFYPRQKGKKITKTLYPNPESAIKNRYKYFFVENKIA